MSTDNSRLSADGSSPGRRSHASARLAESVEGFLTDLNKVEASIEQEVMQALDARAKGTFVGVDDNIFAPHTWYVEFCSRRFMSQRAIDLWLRRLARATAEAEARLRNREGPQARIHKGAPLFNVGLSMFISGDFDRALVFMGEGGVEDERSGRGPAGHVLVGNHPLSELLLVDPVFAWLSQPIERGALYQNATGRALTKEELKDVIAWTATRLNDGIQLMLSLHRLIGSQEIPDNAASKHLRVQALTDLVLVVESTLRRWQAAGLNQLHGRMTSLLPAGTGARMCFDTLHTDFNTRYPKGHPDREEAAAMNWAIDECLVQFDQAATVSERAGIACYLTYRLRNSLMHVIDDIVNIYADRPKLIRAAGLVFCTIRISMHGERGTLVAI